MAEQLAQNRKEGKANRDRGGGKPDVIVADIMATAALMQTASEVQLPIGLVPMTGMNSILQAP